jgi:hypothetical protein
MDIFNCLCMGAIINWYHTLGMRIVNVETRITELEKYVVIDIQSLEKSE